MQEQLNQIEEKLIKLNNQTKKSIKRMALYFAKFEFKK